MAESFDVVRAAGRYELRREDGEVIGENIFRETEGQVTMPHVEVRPDYRGTGLAERLVKESLDDVRARGLKVVPRCGFVAAYLRRHPEYRDLAV